MNYLQLAKEYTDIQTNTRIIEINRAFNQYVQGDKFVLLFLYKNGNIAYPKDISSALAVSTARIAKVLNELEKNEYISRNADTKDNRHVIVRLTEKGISRVKEIEHEYITMVAELFELLGEDDAKDLIRIHEKINRLLSKKILP